jgi:tripartite-type tricarboxylate transporter receptor subunit TctC
MKRTLLGGAAALFTLLSTVVTAPATAQTVEEFYRGKQITWLIGYPPGVSHEIWARAITATMRKHLPGNPTFVIQHMPGAGTLTMANHLFNTAPKDGTVVGMFARTIPSQVMMGLENAKLDPREFTWIGSPELPTRVCVATTKSGVTSVEDLRKKELIVAGQGAATIQTFLPPMLNQMVGTKFRVVDGYRSAEESYLAMERGEADAFCQSYGAIARGAADMFKEGKLKLLFSLEREPSPQLKGTPSIYDYVKDERDKQILDFINADTDLGRPIAAPPQVNPQRLAALQKAFLATMKDPEFLKEAERLDLEINVTEGDELARRVKNLYAIPKDVVDRAIQLMGTKK